MQVNKVILATPDSEDLAVGKNLIQKLDDFHLIAHAPGLMELFTTVEKNPPNLVLISEKLCRSEEFELMEKLFRTLDIRWAHFENGLQKSTIRQNWPQRLAGLFPIQLRTDNQNFGPQLQSVLRAKYRPEKDVTRRETSGKKSFRRMILIGASTGGIEALRVVLSDFDFECPPTIVVQHTTEGFGSGLVTVLNRSCRAKVKLFQHRDILETGTVYIIAGQSRQVVLSKGNQLALTYGSNEPRSGHLPSIDELFLSALPYAKKTTAAILTGMGRDGVNGLSKLRRAGAITLAQDEKSSVVYGMPGLAWNTGAAMKQVPLNEIGRVLLWNANS